jgi:hypothetical protein
MTFVALSRALVAVACLGRVIVPVCKDQCYVLSCAAYGPLLWLVCVCALRQFGA